MKRKKIAIVLSCLALSGAVLAGCGSNTQSTQSSITQDNQTQGNTGEAGEQTAPDANGGGQESSDGSTAVYGQITKIDGQKITYTVGTLEMPQKGQDGQKPDGQPPQDGQAPSGEKGEMPDLSDKLTLGEETATVTVDDSIDISGLKKGDYITITQDADGNITAVEEGVHPRMGGGPGGQRPDGNGPDGNGSEQSESSSTDTQNKA
jgi:hypothetical protein